MKRGAWKRTVEAALWYTQRPIARARLPGRNSEVGYVFNTLKSAARRFHVPGSEKHNSDVMHVASTRVAYNCSCQTV